VGTSTSHNPMGPSRPVTGIALPYFFLQAKQETSVIDGGKQKAPVFTLVSCLAYSSTLKMEGRHVPPKRRLTFNGLHGVISQSMHRLCQQVSSSSTTAHSPPFRSLTATQMKTPLFMNKRFSWFTATRPILNQGYSVHILTTLLL
jgi:hypothetical protein